jgi:hypothetical protein
MARRGAESPTERRDKHRQNGSDGDACGSQPSSLVSSFYHAESQRYAEVLAASTSIAMPVPVFLNHHFAGKRAIDIDEYPVAVLGTVYSLR